MNISDAVSAYFDSGLYGISIAALLFFVLQLCLCILLSNKKLKLIPIYLIGAFMVLILVSSIGNIHDFFNFLALIIAFIFFMIAPLIGIGLAWLVYKILKVLNITKRNER